MKTDRRLSSIRTLFSTRVSSGLLLGAVFASGMMASSCRAQYTDREIQQALDRLPTGGGEVRLGPHVYTISQPVVLQQDGQSLRGSGPETLLRLADGANCPVVILGQSAIRPVRAVKRLSLSDLAIDGNRLGQQQELWETTPVGYQICNDGVIVRTVADSAVERVVAAHCRSGGLVVTLDCRRVRLSMVTAFDNQFDGLACTNSAECSFSHLNLHDNLAAGISLDFSLNHNEFSDARLTHNRVGLFMRDSHDNIFRKLVIRQSLEHGIFMAQSVQQKPGGWQLVPHTECLRNSFIDLEISDSGGPAFRVNDATCTPNLISGVRFHNNPKGGLSLAAPGILVVRGLVED